MKTEQHLRYHSVRGRLALTASILGSGMAFLDGTAVNVALPAIEADLHTGFAGLQWILDGYLLALAALVLPGGSLADRFGRRRIFVIGVIWFAAASVLCGVAPSTAVLIAARVLQGIGAALLVPASLAMVQSAFEPDDRGPAIGAWSGFSGLTTIVGPLLGGWFADAVSWRLVFLINPLIALVTLLIAIRWVPETKDPGARRLDFAGALTAAVGLGGITFATIEGPEWGWGHMAVLATGAAGLFGLIAFIFVELRAPAPMLPLGFFRRRIFAGISAMSIPIYFGLGGVMFLIALQLQRVLDYTALQAGASLAPVTLLLLVLSPIAGKLLPRTGSRLPLTAGPFIAAVSVAWMSSITAGDTYIRDILPQVLLFGVGLGFTVAPLTATAMAALDEEHAGLASGVSNAVTRMAQLLAISMLPLAAGLSGIEQVGGERFSAGFSRAMWVSAGIMALGALIAFLTLRAARDSNAVGIRHQTGRK